MSGSALFTLGTTRPTNLASNALVFTEAAIGLFLLALLITFLPSIYTAFSRRELGVTALAVRAGEPPSGVEMMQRYWVLERMEELNAVWTEWERWFVDVEETHTSLSSLAFFRSPQADHSWVTAAGAVLDGAALSVSTVDIERDVQAEFCLRAGYLCLRRIAGFFRVPYDADPEPDDPISITREEWEEAVAVTRARGRADQGGPGPGMAGLRGVARELRHGVAGPRQPHQRAPRALVLGSLRHRDAAGADAPAHRAALRPPGSLTGPA